MLASVLPAQWFSSAGTTFLLILLAEFGDKSQLVCMTLATRHRGLPVVIGAVTAFALLNLLAVLFGAAVAAWLPPWLVTVSVAVLFGVFGISALRHQTDADDDCPSEKSGHGVFVTTFLLILLAEFGDKTQIAVAGLGTNTDVSAVWAGATAALACTSAAGVVAGRRLLQHISLAWVHRGSGILFLLLAVAALTRLI